MTILFDGPSTDGDLTGMNRGDFDGTILTFESGTPAAVEKSALNEILEKAKAINNADNKYTELSFNALLDAVKNAESVYNDANASQDDVDFQIKAVQAAIDELAKNNAESLDKNSLKDGSYNLYAYMFKPGGKDYSMANNAIAHKVLLEVVNGEYYITMQLKGLSIYNLFGYLADIFFYDDGYVYNEYGVPTGSVSPVQVISTQKDSDGNDIIDQYNSADSLYPNVIKFRLVSQALEDANGFVPLKIFVPIMETIAEGNGTQDVLMKLDWATLTKTSEDEPGFQPEEPVEQSPAVDITDAATGVKVHADKGVFEKGVKLVVTPITSGADYDNAFAALSEVGKKFKLYEIHFEDSDGNEVQPNGTVTVSYPIPTGYDAANVVLYRINDDGTKTLIKGTVDGNYYTVITKSFSNYALVEKDSAITDEQNTQNVNNGSAGGNTNPSNTPDSPQTGVGAPQKAPQTGDNSNVVLWFMLMFASAGMIAVLTFTRKRRSVNE